MKKTAIVLFAIFSVLFLSAQKNTKPVAGSPNEPIKITPTKPPVNTSPVQVEVEVKTDQRTLFTIGGDKVTVHEFESVYTKNNINNQSDFSEKSLRDYLTLYQNFRLKVKEAEAMKLDTITSLKNELEGYRKQLAKNYLTDREISEKLIQEAYERSLYEINASHILVRCDENANPADTMAAYKKIMALRKRIEKGEPFEKVAKESSEDPSAKTNNGNIGWFSVFGTIYPFESAAYSLKVGELSQPVRTEYGYHLVRVNERRNARGQMRVGHLLVRIPENATEQQKQDAKRKIDSVHALLVKGSIDWETAVREFSEDRATRTKGGELPWFGSGAPNRYPVEFEDAAFSLTSDSAISKPVATQFGWHIIRRFEKRPVPSFNEAKADIKRKVERDSRSQVAKNVLIERIKRENNFVIYPEVKSQLAARIDTNLQKGNWRADSTLRSNVPMFTLAGKSYTVNDFIDYMEKNAKRRNDKNKDALINEYFENFVNAKCLEYEESQLENKKPEFKALMKEYRDGILLFELMERMVWGKAVKDTAGLEEFRKKNETKYMWGERADVAIFNCTDKKIADAARKLALKNKPVADITAKLNKEGAKSKVSVIEGKYEKGQYDVVDKLEWKPAVTPVEKLSDSSYRFVWIKRIVGPEPKTLKEAKGFIVSDYQEYLEKTWLADLRKKYPITVNEDVLRSLIRK
ncbi:MAG: peptidylprolyl isomerase [Chitinophagales bacterium]|nr:peptidylprolyl isomerase [Chitinophagales bacterium]MDW8418359.1 peptidylprolyl isomerase [Chitinophagales bacterium]